MKNSDINRIDSESGIIATLIHHPEFIFHSEHLQPCHFSDKHNSILYTAIETLANNEIGTVDAYNIFEILNASEATRKLADDLNIDSVQDFIDKSDLISRNSVEEYKVMVSNVLDAAFRRDTLSRLDECSKLCRDMGSSNIEKQIYDCIDEVMIEYSAVKDDVPLFGDVVDDLWCEIKAHQDGIDAGIKFKFKTLNEYVTLEQGELVVVGAPAKGAKSMFMMNEAVDILMHNKSVLYIDSELSSRLFLCRMLSHLTGIEFVRIRSGRYTSEEEEIIEQWIDWLKGKNFVHIYMPILDTQSIYAAVKKISHKFGKLDVVIMDYLKSSGESEAFATYQELGKLTDMFKNEICGAMEIAGLAAAQLTSTNKLADSAKISRNASTILYLLDKTEEEIEEDGVDGGNKKLICRFNRNGMQHVEGEWINLEFNGNRCTLEEAKTQHIPDSPF